MCSGRCSRLSVTTATRRTGGSWTAGGTIIRVRASSSRTRLASDRRARYDRPMPPYASKLLVLVSAIGLVLTAFGVTIGDTTELEMLAGSLFFFVASFLVP